MIFSAQVLLPMPAFTCHYMKSQKEKLLLDIESGMLEREIPIKMPELVILSEGKTSKVDSQTRAMYHRVTIQNFQTLTFELV